PLPLWPTTRAPRLTNLPTTQPVAMQTLARLLKHLPTPPPRPPLTKRQHRATPQRLHRPTPGPKVTLPPQTTLRKQPMPVIRPKPLLIALKKPPLPLRVMPLVLPTSSPFWPKMPAWLATRSITNWLARHTVTLPRNTRATPRLPTHWRSTSKAEAPACGAPSPCRPTPASLTTNCSKSSAGLWLALRNNTATGGRFSKGAQPIMAAAHTGCRFFYVRPVSTLITLSTAYLAEHGAATTNSGGNACR